VQHRLNERVEKSASLVDVELLNIDVFHLLPLTLVGAGGSISPA